jgi:hypothetical protein
MSIAFNAWPRSQTVVLAGALVLLASRSFGQGSVGILDTDQELGCLHGALELGIGVAYSQGVGSLGGGDIPSLTATAGGGELLELDVGWRLNPNLLFGAYGNGAKLNPRNAFAGADIWSFAAGLHANWHFLPGKPADPWIEFGGGYRVYSIAQPEGTEYRHGLDVVRIQVGVETPLTKQIAISAFFGGALSLFLTRKGPLENSYSSIPDPQITAFFNAGLMARFDLFGAQACP